MTEATEIVEIADSAGGGATGGAAAADSGGDGAQAQTGPAPEPAAAVEAPASGGAPEPIEIEFPDGDEPERETEAATPQETGAGAEAAEEAAPAAARYGTAALSKLLKENPGLEKAAAENPRVRAQLYQMARRSQELAQYQELVPSLGRAREALEARQALANFDQAYFGHEPEQFWQQLHAAGPEAYGRNVQFLQQVFLDSMAVEAQAAGNQDLTKAVAAIRDTLGWGSSPNARSQAADGVQRGAERADLPPDIRQRLERAERDSRELEQLRLRRSNEERQASEHFLDETAQEAGREVRAFVDGILAQASLSDYDKQNIARDFLEAVAEAADADKVHNAALEEMLHTGGATPATRAQMVARVKAWARQNGRDILEPILQRAGAGLRQKQAQREGARAKARPEPTSQGAPANPARLTARELVQQTEGKLGRRLSDREILELA